MPRFLLVPALTLAVASAAPAQNAASKPLSGSQSQLVSRLTTEWKTTFRSIATLDMQWKSSGFPFDAKDRHTTNYHFWREPSRHRLDTRFYSWKSAPNYTQTDTVLGEGGAVKDLSIHVSGSAYLTAPYAARKSNPYSVVLPILESFRWARDSSSDLTLEAFGSDLFWQRFASRVKQIEAGSWQGQSGWWLTMTEDTSRSAAEKSDRKVRVFVDGATYFPFLTVGQTHYKSKEVVSNSGYTVQVTKTQPWRVNGSLRLLPLDSTSRSWRHNLNTGERTTQTETSTSLAPVKINAPIAPERWELAIPAKTLVSYALRPDPDFKDVRTFTFVPHGGSLWQQQNHERERHEVQLRRYRALPAIYDEKADGEAQIAAALKLAAAQNKGVLLQFGAYWCPPCHVLHDLLQNDATLALVVKDNFIPVSIDVNNGHNESVSQRLAGSNQAGIPILVVLDATGKRLAAPPMELFAPESGAKPYDAKKLADFLNRWKPQ